MKKMKIQILGTGCAKCNKLYAEAEKAIAQAGLPVELEKIEKIEQMIQFGVMITPALVIDGKLKAAGKIPKADQIAAWIKEAAPY
jgi:small redox-active disulfide protein 2